MHSDGRRTNMGKGLVSARLDAESITLASMTSSETPLVAVKSS